MIKDLCNMLNLASKTEHKKISNYVNEVFLIQCYDIYLSHDEFIRLASLVIELPGKNFDKTFNLLKKQVMEYWEDFATDHLASESVLDHYLDPDDDWDAMDTVIEYLEDTLDVFNFDQDEIKRIAEQVDVMDFITTNQESAARSDYEYEQWKDGARNTTNSSATDSANIKEIFRKT